MGFLAGRGVPSIEDALKEIFLQPIHEPFKELVNAAMFRRLIDAEWRRIDVEIEVEPGTGEEAVAEAVEMAEAVVDAVEEGEADELAGLLDEVEQHYTDLLEAIKEFAEGEGDPAKLARKHREELETILRLGEIGEEVSELQVVAGMLAEQLGNQSVAWGTALSWHFVHKLAKVVDDKSYADLSRSWIDEWLLGRIIARTLQDLGAEWQMAERAVGIVKLLTANQRWFEFKVQPQRMAFAVLSRLLRDAEVQQFIGVNRYQGVLWFNQESYEQLCDWLLLPAVVDSMLKLTEAEAIAQVESRLEIVLKLVKAGEASEYQVEKLLEAAR
jgi:hypothetical protein